MTRWFSVLFAAMFLLPASGAQTLEERLIKLPPQSLSQWYKPENKRQVWLHTMFRLRREMQAVSEYLALADWPRALKWAERLSLDYRRIGEMVPEWQGELEIDHLELLLDALRRQEREVAEKAQRKLALSCRSCHRDYRAVTTALFRTPDFSGQQVTDRENGTKEAYGDAMQRLSTLVNRIKIASEDARKPVALEALQQLRRRMDDLGESCAACHKDAEPRQRILGPESGVSLTGLQQGIEQADRRATGRALGTLAVTVCARCHAVHRSLYDLRRVVSPRR